MPIQHAVLALLAGGESYGYELRSEFERAVGPQWGQLNIGHLYQVLDRLVRDGLVTKWELEQPRFPDRVIYRLTDAGQAELKRWLQTPFVRQAGYRDDFFLKLLAASRLGRRQLDQVLAVQREAYLAELGTLAELRSRHAGEELVALLVEAAILHTKANLRIVEKAEQRASKLAAPAVGRAPRTSRARRAREA